MGQLLIIPDAGNLDQSLALAEEYGCAFEYNDFFLPSVLDDKGKCRELYALYRSVRKDFSRDTLHGAFFDVTIHSDDPKIREVSRLRVRQSMEAAAELGVKGVVFHTGRLYGFRTEKYLKHWTEANRCFFSEILKEYPGIEIYMENMFDEAPDVLAGLAGQMRNEKSFGVCLDYAHALLTPCMPKEWFSVLAPYIRHIHINDNDLENDLHLALGEGKIDWGFYRSMMEKYSLNPSVLVEVTGIDGQRKSLEFLRMHDIIPAADGGSEWI